MLDNRGVIRNCRLFTGLDETQCDRLAAMSLRQTFKRGEAIFAQDDPCPGIYIVETGLVRLFKLNAAGKEHVLHLVSNHATFAEV
ncbi:MAG: cyclic nucleotide-binding domain-containing protein, partial [Phycisphaeraceae bacterium]